MWRPREQGLCTVQSAHLDEEISLSVVQAFACQLILNTVEKQLVQLTLCLDGKMAPDSDPTAENRFVETMEEVVDLYRQTVLEYQQIELGDRSCGRMGMEIRSLETLSTWIACGRGSPKRLVPVS